MSAEGVEENYYYDVDERRSIMMTNRNHAR